MGQSYIIFYPGTDTLPDTLPEEDLASPLSEDEKSAPTTEIDSNKSNDQEQPSAMERIMMVDTENIKHEPYQTTDEIKVSYEKNIHVCFGIWF